MNTTDKYTQCAECGLYIPIGEITKPLPQNLICHGHDDMAPVGTIDDDFFAYTYDEVLFTVEHDGLIPESLYNRQAQYLNHTTPYEYFKEHHSLLPEDLNKYNFHNDPLTVMPVEYPLNEPVIEPIDIPQTNSNDGVLTYLNISVY